MKRFAPRMRYHIQVPAYHVENFGCRATQADGAALERQFEDRGLTHAGAAQADVVVLNTCTVTASADQDARAAIRRIRRQNPTAKIVVTGCYAQRAPQEIAALPGVTTVIGNSHKHQLAEIALADFAAWDSHSSKRDSAELDREEHDREEHDVRRNHFVPLANLTAEARKPKPEARLYVSDIFAHTELLAAPVFDAANERTRPNLKIQDGCDNRCSFCVIPYVRGQSRSLPQDRILREIRTLVAAGYREVVISGINLGRWGRDLPGFGLRPSGFSKPLQWEDGAGTNETEIKSLMSSTSSPKPESRSPEPAFETLLHSVLAETALEKLRISSVEPMDWSDELIALVASSPRIAKHAHVPMQSGSDAVLRRMHRKYRPWHYREKIQKIRAAMPTAAIGADVMTGFPGETDAEFEATRRLIEDLPLTYLHVFTYSPRPGTPAAAMPNQVPVHAARQRNQILRDLATQKKQKFMESFAGKTIDAITLSKCRADTPARFFSEPSTEALTDNYLKLRLQGRHEPNLWLRARIDTVVEDSLVGTAL